MCVHVVAATAAATYVGKQLDYIGAHFECERILVT